MAQKDFFPLRPQVNPMIYAYEDTNPQYKGLLKVGYTAVDVRKRVAEQYPTKRPGPLPYHIVLKETAMRNDGSSFMDHAVHDYSRKHGVENPEGEWFRCSVKEVKAAILAVRNRMENNEQRTLDFKMRPEQQKAVEQTADYFTKWHREKPGETPHFLWNCKMRFGKTFTAYELAKRMGWKKLLVMTFKPAVRDTWESDLKSHVDFEGWQFLFYDPSSHENNLNIGQIDRHRPIVCFGSFQNFMGKNKAGGIKAQNEWVHEMNWDCVIFDEYHYGAWRDKAQDLFENETKAEKIYGEGNGLDYFDEDNLPITTNAYLYLSGTPFRAINSGEFIEEQIYNWTYTDEQRAKANWRGEHNPYAILPRMVMMTYQLPEEIKRVALAGEFNEFDLNIFFSAEGKGDEASFKYKDEVQKWLDMIRGSYTIVSDLKMRNDKPPMPFSHAPLLKILTHTFWFLPSVSSCYAMQNLLNERQNTFYHDYKVIVAAGLKAGLGAKALEPVRVAMGNPLETKTITLSCGKLTTGVSVKPWTGIFMLRNSSSPETYFQAAFRVQTPWTLQDPDNLSPDKTEILKNECYVFDFAPNRALRQISDYSCRLNVDESNPERKVADFINFLPVLAYDGSCMKQISASEILDFTTSGTSATLLARRWESALLVNVDNMTLQRLMDNEQAMEALMRIEGFRTLNQDIETIINKSEAIKKAKTKANKRDLTKPEKKKLTEDEKEYKSMRKKIQEKLIKFATRIPIFMYLTDYREECLMDVIRQLEPELFQKVTGLTLQDFDLLVSLGVFNEQLMNDAVYKFKRYEDASLEYTGINRHKGKNVGLFNTALSYDDYKRTFKNEDIR